MCDVPSTVVFCRESAECFPDMDSIFFFKRFVTVPVAPIIVSLYIKSFTTTATAAAAAADNYYMWSTCFGLSRPSSGRNQMQEEKCIKH